MDDDCDYLLQLADTLDDEPLVHDEDVDRHLEEVYGKKNLREHMKSQPALGASKKPLTQQQPVVPVRLSQATERNSAATREGVRGWETA